MDKNIINEYTTIKSTIKSSTDKLNVLRGRLKELDQKIQEDMKRLHLNKIVLENGGTIYKRRIYLKKRLKKDEIISILKENKLNKIVDLIYNQSEEVPADRLHFNQS